MRRKLDGESHTSDENHNGVEDPGLHQDSLGILVRGGVGDERAVPGNQQDADNN